MGGDWTCVHWLPHSKNFVGHMRSEVRNLVRFTSECLSVMPQTYISVGILTKLAGFPQIWRDSINLARFLNLSVFSQSLKFSRSCQDMEKQHRSEKPPHPQ
jgi:hypothetical protein